ncbi:MAG: MATE family efflux transporter, partial [Eisenbergiella sp.]
ALSAMRIDFSGSMPSMMSTMGSGILRAIGDSKRPLYFLIAACLVNIALDLLFVAVLEMGVAGAALATILSQLVSAILTTIALMRTTDSYRLILSKIRFHRHLLFSIVKIGLPAGLQSSMYSISNLLIQSSINSFGTDTIAAWTAYGKVDSIFWMIMGAYGISATTFVGQNFGAGKYDRIKKSVRICLGMAAITSIVLSVIVMEFGGTILLLFTHDANVISICEGMIRVVSPFYITYICIEILSGTCRGCGDSLIPMLLTCFGVCVLRIVWIFTAVPLRHEVSTVAFSYPLTWAITSILFVIYYKKGKWMQKDTLRNAPPSQE